MLYVEYGKNRLHRRSRLKMLTTDGRRMPAYIVSSPLSLQLRWAKKKETALIGKQQTYDKLYVNH